VVPQIAFTAQEMPMQTRQLPNVQAHHRGDPAGELTMVRRIGRESITLLGGGRATLLQLAHPLIAAGVNEHSYFRQDPMTRLARTMHLMLAVVFGDEKQVQKAMRQFHAVHRRVHGSLSDDRGKYSAGTSYRAEDPTLKLWVHATLIDTTLIVYDRFVAPLSHDDRARFYAESKIIGGRLGIPAAIFPPTIGDFDEYMQEMLEGNTLAVTDVTRALARYVLYPKAGLIPRSSARLLLFATAGLLPTRLREAYGMSWGPSEERLLEALSRLYKLARPITPKSIALLPLAGGGQLIKLALRRYYFDS
jgi:uncharacterized protein (DUF2236 family)